MQIHNFPPESTQILNPDGSIADFSGMSGSSTPAPQSFANLDFSVNNVDNTAYVELIPTVGATDIKEIQIFMSSGDPLYLAFGAMGAEVDKAIIIPGGNGVLQMAIPSGTRLSVKAIYAVTVTSGNILTNLLG